MLEKAVPPGVQEAGGPPLGWEGARWTVREYRRRQQHRHRHRHPPHLAKPYQRPTEGTAGTSGAKVKTMPVLRMGGG